MNYDQQAGGLPLDQVLEVMIARGLVEKRQGPDGVVRYRLTERGKQDNFLHGAEGHA